MSIPCPAVTSIDITIAEKSLNRSWLMITSINTEHCNINIYSIVISIQYQLKSLSWLMITGGLEAILNPPSNDVGLWELRMALDLVGARHPRIYGIVTTIHELLMKPHGTPLSKAVAHGDFPDWTDISVIPSSPRCWLLKQVHIPEIPHVCQCSPMDGCEILHQLVDGKHPITISLENLQCFIVTNS